MVLIDWAFLLWEADAMRRAAPGTHPPAGLGGTDVRGARTRRRRFRTSARRLFSCAARLLGRWR